MTKYVDININDNQAGFHPKRGTRDQLIILRWFLSLAMQSNIEVVVTFVDFKAAFDTFDHEYCYQCLANIGCPPKIIQLIKLFCDLRNQIQFNINDIQFGVGKCHLRIDEYFETLINNLMEYQSNMKKQLLTRSQIE